MHNFIQAFDGQKVQLDDPIPENFSIFNVAHSLAFKCRFNGHLNKFFSVAQHAYNVSFHTKPENAMYGLLHEVDEVFLPDVPSPLKPLIPDFNKIADMHMRIGLEAFGLKLPIPEDVWIIDLRELYAEKNNLLTPSFEWEFKYPPLDIDIKPVSPEKAEEMFLNRYAELYNKGLK